MESRKSKSPLLAKVLQRLHHPMQLRMTLTGFIVVLGYGVIYLPLSNDIAETQAKVKVAQKRLHLTKDIESLRAQFKLYQPKLSAKPDPNEWIQYVLEGIRRRPVNLLNMDFRPTREVGPYQAIVLHLELEGSFKDLQAFLGWLENDHRLFRVDGVYISPPQRTNENLVMDLTLLGMMG